MCEVSISCRFSQALLAQSVSKCFRLPALPLQGSFCLQALSLLPTVFSAFGKLRALRAACHGPPLEDGDLCLSSSDDIRLRFPDISKSGSEYLCSRLSTNGFDSTFLFAVLAYRIHELPIGFLAAIYTSRKISH